MKIKKYQTGGLFNLKSVLNNAFQQYLGNVVETIAKYNQEHGTNYTTLKEIKNKDRANSGGLWSTLAQARDARIGAVGAQEVRDLYSKGRNEEAKALASMYMASNLTGASLPIAFGGAGPVAADIVNGIYSADMAKNFLSNEGVAKTIRLASAGDTSGAIKSGLGDALNLLGVSGTGRLLGRIAPQVSKGKSLRNAYIGDILGRSLGKPGNVNLGIDDVSNNILSGKIGWGPKINQIAYHHSKHPLKELDPMFKSWDVEFRNSPRGKVWLTETKDLTEIDGPRPYHYQTQLVLKKPIVQLNEAVGNGKNNVRNKIVQFAQQADADGIAFKNIKDNKLANQNQFVSFNKTYLEPIPVNYNIDVPTSKVNNVSTITFDPRVKPYSRQISEAEQLVKPIIEDLGGGYMLKSLMRGNPLEKQIGKNGTVNVNNIRAIINKGSNIEKAVVDKILSSEQFAGQKAIDYNKFRKAVQDELITYERTPDTRYNQYGISRLGFSENAEVFRAQDFLEDNPQLPWRVHRDGASDELVFTRRNAAGRIEVVPREEVNATYGKYLKEYGITGDYKTNTFTFRSPRIPNGSSKHYDANTLGHSRTYTTADEPDVLHVMESQSDWAQGGGSTEMNISKEEIQNRIKEGQNYIKTLKQEIASRTSQDGKLLSEYEVELVEDELRRTEDGMRYFERILNGTDAIQSKYLSDNYTSRQIQENLRYAAEKGQRKMRYPTRETAAKIEGYPEREAYFDAQGNDVTTKGTPEMWSYGEQQDKELQHLRKAIKDLEEEYTTWVQNDTYVRKGLDREGTARAISNDLREAQNSRNSIINENEPKLAKGYTKKVVYDYEDILHKYTEFPKQFKKLYKNADVRTVTDAKGNTWYEVGVPKDYLKQEWQFKKGGKLYKSLNPQQ